MKNLRVRKRHDRLEAMIADGETQTQDFKFSISDAAKIARTIAAFANTDGGCLLVGVRDDGRVAGVRSVEEESSVIEYAAQSFCRPQQPVEFEAWRDNDCHVVLIARIARAVDTPVFALDAADDPASGKVYIRSADENFEAHPLVVRALLMRPDIMHEGLILGADHYTVFKCLEHGPLTLTQLEATATLSRARVHAALLELLAAGHLQAATDGREWRFEVHAQVCNS